MKLSIFTTITHPAKRGDNVKEALACYKDLADELVIVDGSEMGRALANRDKNTKKVYNYWPNKFSWELIGQQFQRGYEAATGDWVIHADLDFIFHEDDFAAIRKAMEDNPDAPALSFWKYQFILPDRYNLKSRLVIAVNKGKYGNRIRFDSGGDLCQPSLDGKEIKPDDVPEARVPFYNYEKLSKTVDQVKDDVKRMDRAYHSYFGRWLYSDIGRDNEAYNGWLRMVVGRFKKPQEHISIDKHPKYIRQTIENLTPDQFGCHGFGELETNDYVKSIMRG
jgi:glycosyltransferase involved in cell wall biosynthesis